MLYCVPCGRQGWNSDGDVEFEIDEENKTVTPILPEISVNIAALDENEISYIPKNPDIPLKEIIVLCKEDAVREANDSKKLYQTAEENLKAVIEAWYLRFWNMPGTQ